MAINNVLVVGSGLMGSGIAQVCAQAGIQVVLNDVSEEALERARRNIAVITSYSIHYTKLYDFIPSIPGTR